MSYQVDKIYKEYFEKYREMMESDEFYNYLVSNIGAGDNKISFYHKRKDKKIDEKWINRIEECLIPLDTIIRNPRRFIVQEDEIVPIEKARRITNESVRHLAQHTNLIARVEGDKVTPNEILNVYREESFDIYENRFIYTLLQNVARFVEARRGILFDMTDDESIAELDYEGKFKNGKDEVTYKVEISSTQVVDSLDDDTSNMTILARIERIDRIIKEFLASPFAKTMRGSVPVRPPIMRTNVIMKDPNFKACLVLWQFIETYNDVGYSIDFVNEYKKLDEMSIFALYNQLAINYMFLKHNTEDAVDIDLKRAKKRKQLKPKFVKTIVEEIVDEYDVSDIEIKKVFLDEITKITKKREAKDTAIVEALKNAIADDYAIRREEERRRIEEEKRKAEEERLRLERIKAREEARKAKEAEKKKIAREKAREKARLAKEREKTKERERKAKEKARAKTKIDREKALKLEKEKAAKERQRAREKAIREKELLAAREKAQKKREQEKAKLQKQKLLEKEKAVMAKEREKERLNKQKEAQKPKAKRQAPKKIVEEKTNTISIPQPTGLFKTDNK